MNSNQSAGDTIRLSKPRHILIVRIVWLLLALPSIGLAIWAAVAYLPTFQTGNFVVSRLEYLGADATSALVYLFTIETVTFLFYVGLAIFLIWKRSDDWLVMLIAILLVATGFTEGFRTIGDNPVNGRFVVEAYQVLYHTGIFAVLLLFPDKEFWPNWTWTLIPLALGIRVLMLQFIPQLNITLLIAIGFFVYKYVNHLTLEERQQAKWLAIGFVLFLIGGLGSVIFNMLPNTLSARTASTVFVIVYPLDNLLKLMPAVGITIAILKFRLWDINIVINRALVYGTLSVVLVGVLVGGFFAVNSLLQNVFAVEQELIAVAIPAVSAALLFNPVRKSLRQFVDRQFFGIHLHYESAGRPVRRLFGKQVDDERPTIGPYTDLHPLGRGGMGEVFAGYDSSNNRRVAVKLLSSIHAGKWEYEQRFTREAQILIDLQHPNIVDVYAVGPADGRLYMAMEYIEGQDLGDMLKKEGALPLSAVIKYLEEVASALDTIHEAGIIHRDVKPSNIMIENPGESEERAVLMDFGIAKLTAISSITGTDHMIGTMDYIAPEQIKGARDVDNRADIYSLGIMVFQSLTGELPYPNSSPSAAVFAHIWQPVPDPRDLRPEMEASAAEAIMRAMAKDPGDRFSTAGDFVAALKA